MKLDGDNNNISALERLAIKLEVQNEQARLRLVEQGQEIERLAELLRVLKESQLAPVEGTKIHD